MIVELVEINGCYYIKQKNGEDWYVCATFSASNFIQVDVIPFDEPRPTSLKPEEVIALSKSGVKSDDIIRLRQAGVL